MSGFIFKRNVFFGFGISFFIFLFVASCSRIPGGIIPERKMQKILVDMQLAEAMINIDIAYRSDKEKKALYQSIFEKHHITEAVYDSSLIWYGKNLDVYMQVYNMALAEVKRTIEEIGQIEPEIVYSPNQDSIDIWSIDRYYEFSPSSLSNTLIFNFREKEEYTSGSVFALNLHVWGLDSGTLLPIEVQFCAEQNDTTIVVKNNINTNGYHEMILRSVPTKEVKQVYGYIRLNGGNVPYHKIYLDDFHMMKYFYGSYGSEGIEQVDSLSVNDERNDPI